jgi:hypothetical protein
VHDDSHVSRRRQRLGHSVPVQLLSWLLVDYAVVHGAWPFPPALYEQPALTFHINDLQVNGYSGYHCFLGCRLPNYYQLSWASGHACQGGQWAQGGTLCRRTCPDWGAPANFQECEKMLW